MPVTPIQGKSWVSLRALKSLTTPLHQFQDQSFSKTIQFLLSRFTLIPRSIMELSCRFLWVSLRVWNIIVVDRNKLKINHPWFIAQVRDLELRLKASHASLCVRQFPSKINDHRLEAPAKEHDALYSIFRLGFDFIVRRWNRVKSTRKREILNTAKFCLIAVREEVKGTSLSRAVT